MEDLEGFAFDEDIDLDVYEDIGEGEGEQGQEVSTADNKSQNSEKNETITEDGTPQNSMNMNSTDKD